MWGGGEWCRGDRRAHARFSPSSFLWVPLRGEDSLFLVRLPRQRMCTAVAHSTGRPSGILLGCLSFPYSNCAPYYTSYDDDDEEWKKEGESEKSKKRRRRRKMRKRERKVVGVKDSSQNPPAALPDYIILPSHRRWTARWGRARERRKSKKKRRKTRPLEEVEVVCDLFSSPPLESAFEDGENHPHHSNADDGEDWRFSLRLRTRLHRFLR